MIFDWRWWLIRKIYNYLDKVSADIKKIDFEPIYNKMLLKTKIKSHYNEVTDKKIPKVDSNHTCLAVISLDSAIRKGYYY